MRLPAQAVATNDDAPGRSARRRDGALFVTGKARYTADTVDRSFRHAVFVRSEVAHGRIRTVDVSRAEEVPGVHAVIVADDLADAGPLLLAADPAPLGGNVARVDYLADGRVLYVGQPYAVVIAESLDAARTGASRVRADIEQLSAVLSAADALRDGAPLLYDDWGTNVLIDGVTGEGERFDADLGRDGEHTLHGEIAMARSSTGAMEPRACQATWDSRLQRLRWCGTTQSPHVLRHILATALHLDEADVQVVTPTQGGSFGVKQPGHADEVLIAVVARMLDVPVRWDESREESLLLGQKEQTISYRAAFDPSGRVHAIRACIVADLGAMTPGTAWVMPWVGALAVPSGYDIQRVSTEWRIVVTNKAPWAAARPFGKEIGGLVMESVMDAVAKRTNLDPLAVRRRNWISPSAFPYDMATGLQIDSGDYAGLADKVLAIFDYDAARRHRAEARESGRLVGIGWGFELMPESGDTPGQFGGAWDTATLRMDPSGHVDVMTGVTSPGNGNETGLAQIVAAELGIHLDKVRIVAGDTDRCTFGGGNFSSRSIVVGGAAAHLAAADLAHKLRAVAGSLLECPAEAVVLRNGLAIDTSRAATTIEISAVAHAHLSLSRLVSHGIDPGLEATRSFAMPNVRHLPDGTGRTNIYATYASALYVCQVEVDPETGNITLERHAMAHDVGTMINPKLVDGQFHGGVVMGLGEALSEALRYDATGTPLATGFKTYLMPRAAEVPPFVVAHQVTPSPFTFMGVKGAGESGVGCSMAALVNAVNDAVSSCGAEVHELPMTPPVVLRAIEAARQEAQR